MLRQVKTNIALLDDKNLVDLLFSIGKLHKKQTPADLNKYGDAKFFGYFLDDAFKEVESRIPHLSPM